MCLSQYINYSDKMFIRLEQEPITVIHSAVVPCLLKTVLNISICIMPLWPLNFRSLFFMMENWRPRVLGLYLGEGVETLSHVLPSSLRSWSTLLCLFFLLYSCRYKEWLGTTGDRCTSMRERRLCIWCIHHSLDPTGYPCCMYSAFTWCL